MPTTSSPFPDRQTLARGLNAVFNDNGSARGPLTILRREPTLYATSFPCEIVRGRFEDGSRLALFCKYTQGNGDGVCSHGQRGGVVYEIAVYRQVLQPSRVSTPTFYGAYTDPSTSSTWLILEYLERSMAVGKVGKLAVMKQAVRWIAQFHSFYEARLSSVSIPVLTSYDAAYYRGWARRTARFAGHWHRRFPWLAALCRRLQKALAFLAARPRTVIHGEYYPHNILFQRGLVRPVDWETAAIGAGQIDLATITEGWSPEIIKQFELEYQQARWPDGPPADFQRALDLARVYVQVRWLGDEPEATTRKDMLPYFTQLRLLSERLELI